MAARGDRAPAAAVSSAGEFLKLMNSTSKADYKTFFKARLPDEQGQFPARIGYYLGLKVAERIAAGSTLPEVARMHGTSVKNKIYSALKALAEQPAMSK